MSQHNRPRRTPGGEEVEDHGGMVRGGGKGSTRPQGGGSLSSVGPTMRSGSLVLGAGKRRAAPFIITNSTDPPLALPLPAA